MSKALPPSSAVPDNAEPASDKPGDSYVQSFARGLSVIRAFNASRPEQTLTDVAAATGLTRAGARRILLTLQTLGYVEAEGRLFRLTPKILDLGFAYLPTPGGDRLGFVDVPGHERFVHTMVAGASGIDLALLVDLAATGASRADRRRPHAGVSRARTVASSRSALAASGPGGRSAAACMASR